MMYNIEIVADADAELRAIPVFHRRQIADMIANVLSTQPERESRSRIKRLIQPAASVYRLRVGDYRVFYGCRRGHCDGVAHPAQSKMRGTLRGVDHEN